MTNGHCDAGERCSCGLDQDRRERCALWKPAEGANPAATKVFGLFFADAGQKALIDKHCMGDCGKVSMAGAIDHPATGPLMVCCEAKCPWLKAEMDEPFGRTMSFGRPHDVYLRALTDTPAAVPCAA